MNSPSEVLPNSGREQAAEIDSRVEKLIDDLRKGDEKVRNAAIEELSKIGRPAVSPVIDTFETDRKYVGRAAAQALAKMSPVSIPALQWALNGENRFKGQQLVLDHLDNPIRGPFGGLEVRYNAWMQECAVYAFKLIGEPAIPWLVPLLKSHYSEIGTNAARALGRIGEPALPPMMEALRSFEERHLHNVAIALEIIGYPAVTPLMDLLRGEGNRYRDVILKRLAVKIIAKIQPEKLREVLSFSSPEKAADDFVVAPATALETHFPDISQRLSRLLDGQNCDPLDVLLCLRSFRAFAESGNLSKAAKRLDCHRDTVSDHIGILDDLLGTLLTKTIVEKNRNLRIRTEVGDALADWLVHNPEHGPLPRCT